MAGIKKHLRSKKGHIGIISVFVVLALFMVVATHYGTKTLSAVRAYVGAEGQWTKAQKEATDLLVRYSVEQDSALYIQFREELKLHKSFKEARQTLISDNPDYNLAFRGFQTADLHPDDIDLLIWLAQFHDDISYLDRAYEIWRQGDQRIAELDSLGRELHRAVREGNIDIDSRRQFIRDISSLDRTLTGLESSFSATMAEGARWLRSLLFWSIVGIGAVFIITGYGITRSFFRDINKLNQELLESESKFKKVLENSRDVIYQLNFESGEYEYMSPYVEDMLGYPPEVFFDRGRSFVLERVHPDDLQQMERELKEMQGKVVGDHFASETEFRIKTKSGDYIWVNNQRSLVKNENNEPVAIVGSVRDISDRKKHEVETEKSLREKQTLLEEIHHRVKNNLAVISSLLELQKNEADASLNEVFEDTQARIQSIAMIHEKLYQTETLSEVDIRDYIEDFADMVSKTFNSQQRDIIIRKDIQSFSLDITKAVPLGLIFNELLNNAFKHGFSDANKGEIVITLKEKDGYALFSVANSGNKLPDNFSIAQSGSLGMTLIKTLTKQLEGELNIVQDEWTKFEITFPIQE